jgi:hypothetical protein
MGFSVGFSLSSQKKQEDYAPQKINVQSMKYKHENP